MKHFLIKLLLVFSCSFYSNAQDLSFVNYSTKDGMSSAQVYQMFQDINGDMLFATDRGITMYDGYEFNRYDLSDGLTNTTVFKFFPQSNGNVWCSTIDNSWFYFKNGTTEFKAYELNPLIQKASKGAQAEDLWIDNNGDMYIGFENFGDYLMIERKSESIAHPLYQNRNEVDSVSANFIKTNDWFTYYSYPTGGEPLSDWDSRETFQIKRSTENMGYKKIEVINDQFLFSGGKILVIVDDELHRTRLDFNATILGVGKFDDSHFWLSLSNGGIKIINNQGKETDHWLKETSPTSLFVDSNGGIWVSTLSKGVYYAQSSKLKYYNSIGNTFINSISAGRNNYPLVCTYDNHFQLNGGFQNELPSLKNKRYKRVYDSVNDQYHSMIEIQQIIENSSKYYATPVLDFNESTDYPLLVAGPYSVLEQKGDFFQFYESSNRITAVEHAENGFLVGGYNGLSFLNKSNSKFETIDQPKLMGRITDIKLKGKFHFIATNGEGLIKYDHKDDRVIQILKKNGLASNIINEVFPESESIVWVATNRGLDRVTFHDDTYEIKHFGMEHGLIDNDISDVYVNNGNIWIGTRTGLCSISKEDFELKKNPTSINLFWKGIFVEQKDYTKSSNIKLAHNQNNIELSFHSSFYGGKTRVKYRYKLDGTNSKWYSLVNRKILLNNLSPGEYKVLLQAKVDNLNWSDHQINTSFTVLPPFYKTWWFTGLMIGLVTFLIYLFFRFRVLIYNRSLVKDLLRLLIRKINPQIKSFVIHDQGRTVRVNSLDVLYLKSDGNYLTIHLNSGKHTIRHKIGEYRELVPDKFEYLRVHKSYVVRVDKITGKTIDTIYLNDIEIPIGKSYKKQLKELAI